MELDHKMGKLSEDDYLNLREKYSAKAIGALKRMDALESKEVFSKDGEDEIEKEVSAIRRQDRKDKPAGGKSIFCTQCGRKRSLEDRFCSWCGAKLSKP
jgi:hypothetical protein